jgi:hypothetical protein
LPAHEVTALRVSVGEVSDVFLSVRRSEAETPPPNLSFDGGQWQFDGQLLLLRERGGQVVKFAVAGGTRLAHGGVTWFVSERPPSLLEVEYTDTMVRVTGPEPVPVLTVFTAGRKQLALNERPPQTVAGEQVQVGGGQQP